MRAGRVREGRKKRTRAGGKEELNILVTKICKIQEEGDKQDIELHPIRLVEEMVTTWIEKNW